jgi:hypothetical protein
VGIRIAEGLGTIVAFFVGSIPYCQLDVLAINIDFRNIVFEYGGDIDL